MKDLEKLVKLLPLGAAILIFLGVLRVSIYYHYFGIDIMSYLSTGEVITYFLNDAEPLIVLVLIGLIHLNTSERFYEVLEKGVGERTFEKFLRRYKVGYLLFYLIIDGLFIYLMYSDHSALPSWMIYLFVFLIVQTVFFFFLRKKGEDLIKNEGYFHLFSVICVLSIIPLMSLKEIREVDGNRGKQVVLFFDDDSKIEASKDNRYLGKAGEYYFFYQPGQNNSLVVKADEVNKTMISNHK